MRLVVAGVIAVVALALAGCGSSHHTAIATATVTRTATAPGRSSSTAATPPARPVPPAGGPVPAGFDPVSFTAISSREFWLLGTAPCAHPVCTSIIRTTDGGAHFVGIPAPIAPLVVAGTGAAGIDTLRFADPLDGYAGPAELTGPPASTGSLWETHDGGAHWHVELTGVIDFVPSGGEIYVLTGSCGPGRCTNLALRRSPTAGDDWSVTPIPLAGQSGRVGMTAHGAAVWVTISTAGEQAHQTLVRSSDGGAHITLSPSPCFNGLGADLEASSASVVWAVCPTGMAAGAWRSSDGGGHWTPLDANTRTQSELVNSATIAPASDTTAVIATGDGQELLRTSDGGASFTTVVGRGSSGGDWSYIGFTDPLTGTALLVGGSGPHEPDGEPPHELWRSSDGGVHWVGPVAVG